MRALWRIITFTKSLTPYYVAIIACTVVGSAAALTTPFITGAATNLIVDTIGSGQSGADATTTIVTGVLWLMVLFVGIELVAVSVDAVGGTLGDIMSERMRAILSRRYFRHLLRLPQRFFDDERTGTIVSRLDRSIVTISTFAKSLSNNFLSTMLTSFGILVITAIYAWPITLLLVIIVPVYVWLTMLTSGRWQRLERVKNSHVDAARGRFNEVVAQMRVVAAFGQQAREYRTFNGHFRDVVEVTGRQSRWWHGMDLLRNVALALVFAATLMIVFVMTARGELRIGDMVVLVQLLIMARQPIMMMSWLVDISQRAIAGSVDYFTVMEAEPERARTRDDAFDETGEHPERGTAPAGVHARRLEPIAGAPAIAFESVSFSYEDGENGENAQDGEDAVHDVSFTVEPGERVALVSESGGGKSTILSLLLGFYTPREGRILIFGHPIETLSRSALRSMIGVVFQDAELFSGTIRENIAYVDPDGDDAGVALAAERANVDEFVARLPDAYDTVIGERGLKLSGGQRQRVAVARAAFKDAPVLVLDEATSALDTKSERLVQAGLDELVRERSSLVVAHRLSTIAAVDRIVTLRAGVVDEIGPPAVLAESGGLYDELLALQESGHRAANRRLREIGIRA